jgi:hypothetical protein
MKPQSLKDYKMNTSYIPLAWKDLVVLEPRLLQLEGMARENGQGTNSFCNWYRHCKPMLLALVGWSAHTDNEVMRQCDSYSTAYRHLIDVYSEGQNGSR